MHIMKMLYSKEAYKRYRVALISSLAAKYYYFVKQQNTRISFRYTTSYVTLE